MFRVDVISLEIVQTKSGSPQRLIFTTPFLLSKKSERRAILKIRNTIIQNSKIMETANMTTEVIAFARPYRSRKSPPCDFCRKRRTCCLKEAGSNRCIGCRVRKAECTYIERPAAKKRPPPRERPQYETKDQRIALNISRDGSVNIEVTTTDPFIAREIPEVESEMRGMDNRLELHNGKTSLFVGFSGDQDPWLLQRVARETPGSAEKRYTNPARDINEPIFFSICPTIYLDPRPDHYCIDSVNEVVKPFSPKILIDTYFASVNPSYPVINASILSDSNQNISATLLAAIYVKAYSHVQGDLKALALEKEKRRDWYALFGFLGKALPIECGAATLQTVQALLLKLHFLPIIIRDANAPCAWVETASLVAVNQDLGLNVDPSLWDLPKWEKRLRRRLWWATYAEDKWQALGLSRPSHIRDEDFSVGTICEDDFVEEGDDDQTAKEKMAKKVGVNMFIALVHLTGILAKMLTSFYSTRTVLQSRKPADEVMSIGVDLINRLNAIENIYFSKEKIPSHLLGSMVSLRLAKATLTMSCCRSILYADSKVTFSEIQTRAYECARDFNVYLETLGNKNLDCHWWSFSRVNFSIVGACILAFYVAADKEGDELVWRDIVYRYRNNLVSIWNLNRVTELALLRFDSLLSRVERAMESESRIRSYSRGPSCTKPSGSPLKDFANDPFEINDLAPALKSFMEEDNFFMEWLSKNNFQMFCKNFKEQ
ncbi:unnamed protein product [Kuraishia capsulata CBS 1993]|uniref:Zn(2)-C6 fungal-type domain-containing protein n=1 Tax=Kuraishia capsulata CBS 1993 TaxID=1382522 RepID=W6MHM1_9ASCO|nr:uncharacterized protein KUCA_T00001215001 [Kuraishia capsulata CBS 1993]CDK25248.1 unnamed protein product [Kuraishia capsulata CBS 1993]